MNGSQDIQSSLAEIDQKLRELRERLAGVFEPPAEGAARVAGPPAAETARPEPGRQAAGPQPPDEPPPPAARPQPGSAPSVPRPSGEQAIPPPPPPPPPSPAEARSPQPRIVSVLELAAAQVNDLQRHIQSLQRVHDELRELIGLPEGQHDHGPGGGTGSRAGPPVSAPAGDAPPAPPAGPGTSAARRAQPDRQGLFEGWVTINAGPFADMWTLGVFERALANLPEVEDVSIRSFEGTRALMDVRLTGAVELVTEMRRAMPFTVGVVEMGDRVLVIEVGAPTAGSRWPASPAAGVARTP